MMTDEQVRRIALFFLLTLTEERAAIQAAHDTIAHLKASRLPKDRSQDVGLTSVEIIRTCRKFFARHSRALQRQRPVEMTDVALELPEQLDFQAWRRFRRDSGDDEVTAVVLAKVLGFSEEEISEGLGLTPGTTRFRIGRGVRQLGLSFGAGKANA